MKIYFGTLVVMLFLASTALEVFAQPPCQAAEHRSVVYKPSQQPVQVTTTVGFPKDMRKLWEDHITWTRLYIVSALSDLPDKEATAQRLLMNQTDIGDAVKPYYGNAAGEKLIALLKDHILIAAEVIDAAKAGDSAKKEQAAALDRERG